MTPAAQPMDAGDGITVVIEDEDNATRVNPDGSIEIDQPDGGVVVQLNPKGEAGEGEEDPKEFYRNLVEDARISDRLGLIANDLIEAVTADDQSRQQALSDRARGLDLLGLKLLQPKSTVGDSASAGGDGMSVVVNPLLLENCLKGWATAQAELLPADGPCKIDDSADPSQTADDLAEAYERDMNHYLTVLAPEYVPDTSQMLLWGTYFGGAGFKKVYSCPIRRRPVSDSVDMKDLIVSDTTKTFGHCERITHQIPMRPSVMKRLQMRGYYRDIPLAPPSPQTNAVDEKIAGIQGTNPTAAQNQRTEDQPFTLWEVQCELDLPEFAPKEFAERHIPLPYLVTLDKDSQTILAIRRDWKPEDEDCKRKQMYVKYPYVPGPGFYGTGMLNIMGNSSAAMTAAWREALDAGMFASFPGGVMSKIGNRQNSSVIRPAPGEFTPIETNGLPVSDVFMGMPYKDVTAGLMAMMDKITAQAKSAGTSAEVPVGEGIQNVPVGTMLAYIEQASKIMAAAHKGMHTAQSEELQLIADLFREDPESFWRGNKKCPPNYWDEQKLFQALNTVTLVPKSDPNIPSHVHRMMKAIALVQLAGDPQLGQLLNKREILKRVLNAMKENDAGLVIPEPPPNAPPPPPSPEMITAQAKAQDAATKHEKAQADIASKSADAALENKKIDAAIAGKTVDLQRDLVIHGQDAKNSDRQHMLDTSKHALDIAQATHDASMDINQAVKPQSEDIKP